MDGPQPVDCVPRLDLDLNRIPHIAKTILRVSASIVHLVCPPQPPGGAENLGVGAVRDVTDQEISKVNCDIAAVSKSKSLNPDTCTTEGAANLGGHISDLEVNSKLGRTRGVSIALVRNSDEDCVLSMNISGNLASYQSVSPGHELTHRLTNLDLAPLGSES